ncbi:hypothetical protein [Nonomuraea sp. NPDC002799]
MATAVTVVAGAVVAAVWGLSLAGASKAPGRIVVDDGRAFGAGGSSRFTVAVHPANTGVRLIRRLDAGIGLQQAAITVNGTPAGTWQPLPGEGVYRWKDQSVDLPPALTEGWRSLTVVNTFVSSTNDFNEFRYDVQHQVDGVWSTADTVDVGPLHTASEIAHDYRLSGHQTFAGTQRFAYPPPEGR